jgi:TrmH family RNA methyltransferase
MLITSVHNPRIKAAIRLRDRAGRDDQGRIIIDGVRELTRALDSHVGLQELYYDPQRCQGSDRKILLAAAQKAGAELIEVMPQIMEKLAFGHRHEGMVAVARPPERRLDDLELSQDALVAVVEGAEKPGNIGAILRTADAAAVNAVIVADGGTDLYNPNAIRASLGAIFTVPLVAATSREAIAWLRKKAYRLYAARVDGAIEYTAANLASGAAIILGSEAHGLTQQWQADDITPIRLPLSGTVDSLNLSATAAVLFYEALRQKKSTQR